MNINVIHGGSVDSFNFLAFPEQSTATNLYIQQQLQGFSQTLTDVGRQFIEGTKAIYDRVNDSDMIRMAKAAIRTAKGVFHPNAIINLESIEDLRSAQPMMQRYIMAQVDIRQQFQRQLIDGYSDSYNDVEPGLIGDKHYDWRRVMTGIVEDKTDENGNDFWVATNYYDDDRPDDAPLDISEKVAILRTWDLAKMFLDAGKDPTDMFGK